MGLELTIAKELSSISVTLAELSAITHIVNREIKTGDFNALFNQIAGELAQCYDVVTINLMPLSEMSSESSFTTHFDDRHAAYKMCYLKEISKPRTYSENAYEDYLVFKTFKESKTSFPLLKRTFKRFDELIDKWVTNDAWLSMNIDNLFKRLHLLLNEIAELKNRDPEEAYLIFNSAFSYFHRYLILIKQMQDELAISSSIGHTSS